MRALPTLVICAIAALLGPALAVDGAGAPRPRLVLDINPEEGEGSSPQDLTRVGQTLFFSAFTPEHGPELWMSRGSRRSTVMVRDINPGPAWGVRPDAKLAVVGDRLFFAGNDGVHGVELWTSDGTFDGTVMVRDIRPGSLSSWPGGFANTDFGFGAFGDILLFGAFGPDGGELWRSDGTEAGTWQVRDIRPGPLDSSPRAFAVRDGVAYFSAYNEQTGRTPWRSDGTPDGTYMIKDLIAGPGGGGGRFFTPVGDTVFFVAHDGMHGDELFRTDGTAAGTSMVRDIWVGPGSSNPSFLRAWGDALFFFADDGIRGKELWRSDGTEAGTTLVRDMGGGPAGRSRWGLTLAGGALYFEAADSQLGSELARSDGTAEGTELIDIVPGPRHSAPANFVTFQGAAYFRANGRLMHHRGRWTRPRSTLGPKFRIGPDELTPIGGSLFFVADDKRRGKELWVYQPVRVDPAAASSGSRP